MKKFNKADFFDVEYYDCECFDQEHLIGLIYEKEEKELWMKYHLADERTVWQRAKLAVKYVLGFRSRYGHWGCFSFDQDAAERFKKKLEKFLEQFAEEEKEKK